ncbi:MAG: Glu-tRNA(Gln) amidotransferase subunit GatD [Candidatus Pacearchaeota archaeon]
MIKKSHKNPQVGDKVEISIGNKKEFGTLLDSHDTGILLLKLDNGYNIGIKKDDITEIKILEKSFLEAKKNKKENVKIKGQKPIIDFILTGGTISSKLDYKTGGVSWLISAEELFSIYPEIFDIADIRIKSPFMKASENMNHNDWIKIAKFVGKSLNDPDVKGVIVSHGTDTLHYTSAALSFMLGKLNKPVVFTYSQRSSDRGSSDSRMNLICAAYMALSDVAEVMLVGHGSINDDFCFALSGTKVRKMHSSRRDAFKPVNTTPIAKIFPNGKIEILKDFNKRNNEKINVDAVFDERVGILKFYPCQDPKILDFYRKNRYKGLIIEMTGLGHVATEGKYNFLPAIKDIIKSGVMVFAVPQTIFGRLNPNVYSPGRKLQNAGVIYLEDILSETAFVKLGWVLAHKEWRGTAITPLKMMENIAGEFNTRINEEFI